MSKKSRSVPHDPVRFEHFCEGRRVRGMKTYDMNWVWCRIENGFLRLYRFVSLLVYFVLATTTLAVVGYAADEEFAGQVDVLTASLQQTLLEDQESKRRKIAIHVAGTSKTGVETFKHVLKSLHFTVSEKKEDARYIANVHWNAERPKSCLKNGYYQNIKVVIVIRDRRGMKIADLTKRLDPIQMPCEQKAFLAQFTEIVRIAVSGQRSLADKKLVVADLRGDW